MRKNLVTMFVFAAAVFAFTFLGSTEVNAQRKKSKLSKAQVDRIIKNLEERTDVFVSQFNKSLDNSGLNGTKREDNLNERARDLESATDELRREFDRRDTWSENRAEVQKCLNIASGINGTMRNRKLGAATENNWRAVVVELNALAKAYGLSKVGKS